MRCRQFVSDSLLSILASLVPTLILQFVVLPAVAVKVDTVDYGLFVSLMALMNLVPGTFGNALNCVCLIKSGLSICDNNNNSCKAGDYLVVLAMLSSFSCFLVVLGSIFLGLSYGAFDWVLVVASALIWASREFLIVIYRIRLDYVGNLYSDIVLSAGYLFGCITCCCFGHWPFILLTGQLASSVYIFFKKPGVRFFNKTFAWKRENVKSISKDALQLSGANFLLRLISYADRLVLLPLLGATAVSTYYLASLCGKLLMMAVSPINTVILSYLSKGSASSASASKALLVAIPACIIFFFLTMFVANPLLSFLYPSMTSFSSYIPYATLASLLSALSSVLTPYVLTKFKMAVPLIVSSITILIYFCAALFLTPGYGLMGFCVAVIAAQGLQFALLAGVYFLFNRKEACWIKYNQSK